MNHTHPHAPPPQPAPAPGAVRVDGPAVRTRRLELGLSERALTAQLGQTFSQAVIRSIEAGRASADLTLGDITQLARVLGLDPRAFIHLDPRPPHTGDGPGTGTGTGTGSLDGPGRWRPVGPLTDVEATAHHDHTVRRLGALLQQAGQAVPAESLAAVLQLHLGELQEALRALDRALAPVGLVTHRVGGSVALRPDTTPETRQALIAHARAQVARTGLTRSQASMLAATLRGDRTNDRTNTDRVALASLVNAGVLTVTATGEAVTAATAFSLLIPTADDPHPDGETDEA